MKHVYITALLMSFFLLPVLELSGQQPTQPSGRLNMNRFLFNSIQFLDQNTGVVVGGDYEYDRSLIMFTEDAGLTWNRIEHPYIESNDLRDLHFSDSLNGYASGHTGTILKTTDGGRTWIKKSIGDDYYCGAIFSIDPDTAWAAQYLGHLLRTTNGFNTHSKFFTNLISIPFDLLFVDADTGFATFGWCPDCEHWNDDPPDVGGYLMRSTDRGNSWQVQQLDTTIWGYRNIYFVNDTTGFVMGTQGSLLRTDDAGVSWMEQSSGSTEDLISMYFLNTDVGFIVGGGHTGYDAIMLKSTDGGQTWTEIEIPTERILYDIEFTDEIHGWAVGDRTMLMTADGGDTWEDYTPVGIDDPEVPSRVRYYPNPTSGLITIESMLHERLRIEISSINGQLILTKEMEGTTRQLDLSSFPKGVYFITIRSKDFVTTRKIVKL